MIRIAITINRDIEFKRSGKANKLIRNIVNFIYVYNDGNNIDTKSTRNIVPPAVPEVKVAVLRAADEGGRALLLLLCMYSYT